MFSVTLALAKVAEFLVLSLAVGAEAQFCRLCHVLLLVEAPLNIFLLSPRQKKPFIGKLNYLVNQANSMVDMVAVEQPDVLIGDQHLLAAHRAVTVTL